MINGRFSLVHNMLVQVCITKANKFDWMTEQKCLSLLPGVINSLSPCDKHLINKPNIMTFSQALQVINTTANLQVIILDIPSEKS